MESKALIVQYSDETKTLPDGSKVIYAESEDRIVVYHKVPLEKGVTYVYNRKDSSITVNNSPGSNDDKRSMIKLGTYFLKHSSEEELVTVNVKGEN
tara:strand:- start:162 stop:449 length:288 start_codon:yes stop_codon:yes gene_type:complete